MWEEIAYGQTDGQRLTNYYIDNYFYVNVDARMQRKRSVRILLSLSKIYNVDGAFLKSHFHFM